MAMRQHKISHPKFKNPEFIFRLFGGLVWLHRDNFFLFGPEDYRQKPKVYRTCKFWIGDVLSHSRWKHLIQNLQL